MTRSPSMTKRRPRETKYMQFDGWLVRCTVVSGGSVRGRRQRSTRRMDSLSKWAKTGHLTINSRLSAIDSWSCSCSGRSVKSAKSSLDCELSEMYL